MNRPLEAVKCELCQTDRETWYRVWTVRGGVVSISELSYWLGLRLIVKLIIILMEELNDRGREEAIAEIKSNFCIYCGSTDSNCQCWNDE